MNLREERYVIEDISKDEESDFAIRFVRLNLQIRVKTYHTGK